MKMRLRASQRRGRGISSLWQHDLRLDHCRAGVDIFVWMGVHSSPNNTYPQYHNKDGSIKERTMIHEDEPERLPENLTCYECEDCGYASVSEQEGTPNCKDCGIPMICVDGDAE